MINTFNMHIILNEIKAKECYPYVPFDERRMSVGADLGRSSNVIPTSERPPVRICGGPSDIQRMFCMSQYDIWRTSVGLPCAMWEGNAIIKLKKNHLKRFLIHGNLIEEYRLIG